MEIKSQILETAKTLFLAQGVKKVTLDDICRTISISKKTLYIYFENKEILVDQVLEKLLAENKGELLEISSKNLSPIDHIREVGRLLLVKIRRTNPNFWPELKKYFTRTYEKYYSFFNEFFLEYISNIIQKGILDGLFRRDMNPLIMARLCLELIKSAAVQENIDVAEQQVLNAQLYTFFMSGMLTGKSKGKIDLSL